MCLRKIWIKLMLPKPEPGKLGVVAARKTGHSPKSSRFKSYDADY